MSLLAKIAAEQVRLVPHFCTGDTVRVHVRIREGDKERTQVFEGVVIGMRRGGSSASFTVRKISYGTGVERLFPLHAPCIEKVERVTAGRVRRARLFFLRARRGKKARLKEADVRGSTRPTVSAPVRPPATT